MDENQTPAIPEKTDNPLNQASAPPVTDNNKLLLKARCEEEEELYNAARDHFIELNMGNEALQCSKKLLQKQADLTRRNKRNIQILAWVSGIFIVVFLASLIWLNDQQRHATTPSVKWLNPGNVELTSYPSWFLYDKKGKLIRARVVIDEKKKMELEKTYPISSDSTHFVEFRQAVEQLAFQSSDMKGNYYWLLLLVSGLAAVIGVLIREILDLIRHFCYKKDLDFRTWWPWYFLRPFVGFMFGIIVVLFSGTDLLISPTNNNSETYLIAIAIIAGISVEDVMFKIRKVSLVLFGNNNPNADPEGINYVSPDNVNPENCKNQPEVKKGNPTATDLSAG